MKRGRQRSSISDSATWKARIFFRFLVHQHYLLASPADELTPPEKESALPRFLSEAEYKRLLAAARHAPRDLAIIELLLQTGIRRLELVNLLLTDVQLPEKMPQTMVRPDAFRAPGASPTRARKELKRQYLGRTMEGV